MSNENRTELTAVLLQLDGKGEINRQQIAAWIGRSLSYVDQRMQDTKDWSGEDVLILIRKGMQLRIPEIIQLMLPKGDCIVNYNKGVMELNGVVDDELCDLAAIGIKARNGQITINDKQKAHELVERMYQESKK